MLQVAFTAYHARDGPSSSFVLYFVLGWPHVVLIELRQALIPYQCCCLLSQTWSGMVSMVDETVSNLTTALKARPKPKPCLCKLPLF